MRLAHIIHDGSSRNRAAALQDRHTEPRRIDAYLKQYVEGLSGEHARRSSVSAFAAELLMNNPDYTFQRLPIGLFSRTPSRPLVLRTEPARSIA